MSILKESWQLLSKPTNIIVKEGSDPDRSATIIMEPFERGYGNTLGNSLRRVLLSSIAGFAVTSVKIEGVLHEYDTIDGVKEDVAEIIMNIKSLAILKSDPSPASIRLTSNKEGTVFAGSIKVPEGVTIMNKDIVICTLNKGAKIDIQMNITCGRGYVVASKPVNQDVEVGEIFIDSVFSPVKRVAYKVENARVGQITDYDRLVMDIETNGAITPRDALGVAAKIIQDQMSVFINFDINEISDISADIESEPEFNKNLLKSIDELELSVRSYNCLKNERISYVGDLAIRTEAEMLKTSNFGRKSLNELKDNLKSMGLSFGMKILNWPPENIEELSKNKNKDF